MGCRMAPFLVEQVFASNNCRTAKIIKNAKGGKIMSKIDIQKVSIIELEVDAIVNAANTALQHGGGVCGVIFDAAGERELQAACNKFGHCNTGNAIITPGFKLPAKYVIHAVGPIWRGGYDNEPKFLYSAYTQALTLAKENDLHSIAFPLISAGIYGYPKDQAWRKALQACHDFIEANDDYEIDIIFAVIDDDIMDIGLKARAELNI